MQTPGPSRVPLGWDRRRFLVSTGVGGRGGGGRWGNRRRSSNGAESKRSARAIPDSLPGTFAPGGAGQAVPADATVDPVTPFITPNGEFYRIDTALSFPRINLPSWKVDINGHGRPADHAELRRSAGPTTGRADRHVVLRVERGRRRVHLQRLVPRRAAGRSAEGSGRAGGRRAGLQHQPRRVDVADSRCRSPSMAAMR